MSTPQERAPGTLLLGNQKYLYATFFVGAVLVAYVVSGSIDLAWGEGHEQTTNLVGMAAGAVAAAVAWRRLTLRTLVMECIDELAAVTWPTRQEIQTNTLIVIATSIGAAVLVFVLDRFWNFLTDLIFLGVRH